MTGHDDPKVVIRCGHVIPQIRLTPPDERPAKAPEVPEQDLGANRLYVPLRTEEVGWEEGGLIWAPKRYCYPTVNLYGGSDDHVIGSYRGGPKGYRFIKITDPAFSLTEQHANDFVATTQQTSSKSSGGKSQLPKGPAKAVATNVKPEEQQRPGRHTCDDAATSDDDASCSAPSSASSSRQGSFSTDDGHSSGADTGMTTPMETDSPVSHDKDALASQLDAALTALSAEDEQTKFAAPSSSACKLASRTGAGAIPSEPVDVSRLGGPYRSQLNSNALGHDRSLTLTEKVPEQHFTQHRGRSTSRLSVMDLVTADSSGEYAAGWAYEQNMRTQLSTGQSQR